MSEIKYTKNIELTQYEGVEMPELLNNITDDNKKIDDCCGDVQEILADHTEKILRNKNDIARNARKIMSLEESQVEQDGQIAIMNTHLESVDIQLETQAGDISALDVRVTKNEEDIADLDTRMDDVEEAVELAKLPNIVALENKVNTNTKNIADLQSDVRILQERVDNIDEEITTINGRLDEHDADLAYMKECCDEVKTTLTDLQNQIDEHTVDIAEANTAIENLTLRVEAIETDMGTLSAQVESNTDRITALENYQGREAIEDLRNKIDANKEAIEELESTKANVHNLPVGTLVTITKSIPKQTFLVCTSTGRMFTLAGNSALSGKPTNVWSGDNLIFADANTVQFKKPNTEFGMVISHKPFELVVTTPEE